ncbi:MAG: carbamoyltransferase N-terminal domain-containing protein, partial [Pseudomonadota bacterium]
GGRIIEGLAINGRGDRIAFPRAYLSPGSLDFSFSGIKTSVSLYVNRWREGEEPQVKMEDIVASFQEAIIHVLVQKIMAAREKIGVDSIVLAGGVACNSALRERLKGRASEEDVKAFCPRPAYCTDNGAMIALAGYHRIIHGERAELSVDVRSRFPIEDLIPIPR